MKKLKEIERDRHVKDIKIVSSKYKIYAAYLRMNGFEYTVEFGYNEDGYEHVSISPVNSHRMPSWDDMSRLKNIFFYPEEEAYQIMPKKSEYVNVKGNCLHLWRPANGRVLQELV